MKNFQHINFHSHHNQWLIESEHLKLHHYTNHGQAANILVDTRGENKFEIFWHNLLFPI